MTHLYRLKPSEIWRFLLTQKASFWLLCIYLFLEYIRPQQLRDYINIFPWAQTALILTIVAFLFEGRWFGTKHPVTWWLLVFTGIVAASIMTAQNPEPAMSHLDVFFIWVVVYFLIVNILRSEKQYFVFLLSYLIYHFYMTFGAIRQWGSFGFGFRSWGLAGGAGWFANSGDFGVALCIFLPLSLYFALAIKPYISKRKFYFVAAMPATALLSILGSASRGAVLGAGAVGIWMLMRTKYRFRGLFGFAAIVAIGFLLLPAEQKARFTELGKDPTSVSRLTYWKDGMRIASEHSLHGIGYYGWLRYYGEHFPRRRADGFILSPELPHNVFVLAAAELGYPGLLLLIGLIAGSFVVTRRTRKLAWKDPTSGRFHFLLARGFDGSMIGFIASGFFDTVLWYPFFWIQLALIVAHYAVVRDKVAAATRAQRIAQASRTAPALRGA